jgi:hypothetical protein
VGVVLFGVCLSGTISVSNPIVCAQELSVGSAELAGKVAKFAGDGDCELDDCWFWTLTVILAEELAGPCF